MQQNGFFGFEIDGEMILAYLDTNHDDFATGYLDWIRNTSKDELLIYAQTLKTVDKDATNDDIAVAFGYRSAFHFYDLVLEEPMELLTHSVGNPGQMVYNGVVYGSTQKSDFVRADYGYIINIIDGTIDCYIGNQLVHHNAGIFSDIKPVVDFGEAAGNVGASSVDVYPPRLFARIDWDALPSKADFVRSYSSELDNQMTINGALASKSRSQSIRPKRHRRSTISEKALCGKIVSSTNKPCLLGAQHKGRCRSV